MSDAQEPGDKPAESEQKKTEQARQKTLVDFLDQRERAAFERSLRHRSRVEPASPNR